MGILAQEIYDMHACTGKPSELSGIPNELVTALHCFQMTFSELELYDIVFSVILCSRDKLVWGIFISVLLQWHISTNKKLEI